MFSARFAVFNTCSGEWSGEWYGEWDFLIPDLPDFTDLPKLFEKVSLLQLLFSLTMWLVWIGEKSGSMSSYYPYISLNLC